MEDAIVLAKKEAAIKWCKNASDYAAANGGKLPIILDQPEENLDNETVFRLLVTVI